MSVIPKITCRRCGREYSGLRSRCPYCGTSRKKSAERIPLRTSSENAGTPAAEHAAVNTKWQLLFGGILLIAVVAAVIVLITVSLNAEKNSSAAVDPTPPATVSSAAPVTTPENFVQTCKKPLFFVGDGATLCYNTYKNVPGVVCVPQPMQVLRGAGVALAAKAMWERGECVPPAALLPDYHRLSQAERERAEREKTEGKQNEV